MTAGCTLGLKTSPATFAILVDRPVLMPASPTLHSMAPQIPADPTQKTIILIAEQFYAALKLYKVEAVLVLVPGEPHGIGRTPSHHVQKITYITNWFDMHRKK